MAESDKKPRICNKGHHYFKSSSCPVCPVCEEEGKPKSGLLSLLSAPARRALEHKKVLTVEDLSEYSEAEVLKWHGIGKSSIPKLEKALEEKGLTFKKTNLATKPKF